MLRPAFVIAAHKLPRQLVHLVQTLATRQEWPIVVHVDRKHRRVFDAAVRDLERLPNVVVLSLRSIHWGDMSLVEAILDCMRHILAEHRNVTHVKYMSGQDFPIRTLDEYVELLGEDPGRSFLETVPVPNPIWIAGGEPSGGLDRVTVPRLRVAGRMVKLPIRRTLPPEIGLYSGSAICCFSRAHAEYILDNAARYRSLFRFALSPDEMFFQTVLGNSPHASQVVDNCLTYTTWEHDAAHPKILGPEDFDALDASGCYFARKFDVDRSGAYMARYGRVAGRSFTP